MRQITDDMGPRNIDDLDTQVTTREVKSAFVRRLRVALAREANTPFISPPLAYRTAQRCSGESQNKSFRNSSFLPVLNLLAEHGHRILNFIPNERKNDKVGPAPVSKARMLAQDAFAFCADLLNCGDGAFILE